MKMPGFNADVSLYKTNSRHQMAGTSGSLVVGGEVVPQVVYDCSGRIRVCGEDPDRHVSYCNYIPVCRAIGSSVGNIYYY